MKYTTLEKVLWALEDMVHEIQVPQEIMDKARTSIEKMLGETVNPARCKTKDSQ